MKKTILIILWLVAAFSVAAKDHFYIEDITIDPGETKMVSIMLDNADEYTAFQADMYLPEGLSVEFEDDEYVFYLTARRGSDHTISSMLHEDGAIRIISYSMNLKPYKGNSGALVTFILMASEDFEGPAKIYLKNVLFTTPLGVEVPFNNESCRVTTSSYVELRGDANDDGMVSIADISAIIDYILRGRYDGFVFKAGDVDLNGVISVADVVTLIDYLLYQVWPS